MAELNPGGLGALYDANNYLVLVLFVSYFLHRRLIEPWLGLVLVASGAVPFLLNDVLFPTSYMPDQWVYTRGVNWIRSDGFYVVGNNNTSWASRMLALVPIPFIETSKSLGFANKLIYCALVIWLVRHHALKGAALFFILFYPSVVLYSGLSLRDTLIMTFMLMSVLLMIENRTFLAFAMLLPLGLIKFQNGVILLLILIMYRLYLSNRRRPNAAALLAVFVAGMSALFVLSLMYLDLLNLYRVAMVVEDGGRPTDVTPITGAFDLVVAGLGNAVFFLMKPFPWEARNALQLIQSVENVVVAGFLVWFTRIHWRIDWHRTIFWIASLFVAFAIYGLVVANFGTAARYRYPFLILYVVALAVDVGRVSRAAPARPRRARLADPEVQPA